MPKKLTLVRFVVHCAIGRRRLQAVGVALIANFPKTFSVVVSRIGIPLKHAENVRPALINGVGHRACIAPNGRATKIGMKIKRNNTETNLLGVNTIQDSWLEKR